MLQTKTPSLTQDALYGGAAGGLTGIGIAWLEVIKVNLQLRTFKTMNIYQIATYLAKESFKTTPQFSAMFGIACAAEFSVNSRIRTQVGEYPALFASAFTGALCLTPAEHIMLISAQTRNKILGSYKIGTRFGLSGLWTGMSSMLIRESFFIFNLFLAGKNLGKMIQERLGEGDNVEAEEKYKAIGRLTCGLLTTTVSHPFDSLAREMQKAKLADPMQRPSLLKMIQQTRFRNLWDGLTPRLVFANIGGTMAAYLYEHFQSKH